MSDVWVHELAESLGVEPLTGDETSRLLAAARDVAHGVERRITPLSTFVLGAAVAERTARGSPRDAALDEVLTTLEELLPDVQERDAD